MIPFEMPLDPIFYAPIKISTLFTLTSGQKDNIDAILDEIIVFTRDNEVQQFLV
jgi:hypothetical protein